MAKVKEPEILENGIKVYLGKEYWILFVKSWSNTDGTRFRNSSDPDSLRLLINKTVDWNVPDAEWNPLPFDKEKLLGQLNAFSAYQERVEKLRSEGRYSDVPKETMPDCFALPTSLQMAMSNAFYTALSTSYSLPFEN